MTPLPAATLMTVAENNRFVLCRHRKLKLFAPLILVRLERRIQFRNKFMKTISGHWTLDSVDRYVLVPPIFFSLN